MTVTDRVLEANRANARKSTGPRTRRGKNRARMNALRHGFFAVDLLLTDEDRSVFYYFRERMLKTLAPQDCVELMLCERIVSASWRLRRLQTIEGVTHHTCAGLRIAEAYFPGSVDEGHDQPEADQADEADEAPTYEKERFGLNEPLSERDKRQQQAFVDQAMNTPGISSIAHGLAKGDDLLERLSRYEQRLDMLIYRAMRQLERYRKRSRSAARDESAEASARPVDTNRVSPADAEKCTSIVRNEPASDQRTCAPSASLGNPRSRG